MKGKMIFLCIELVLLGMISTAQYKVSFIITRLPGYHKNSDSLFLAGSFNQWKPGDPNLRLETVNGKPGITIELAKGMHEFKMTRGSWKRVEAGEGGLAGQNRSINIESDTTLEVEIAQWADHFAQKEKVSTASKNVHIIDDSFYVPQLNRYRRIWIYLPARYHSSRSKYPVLYMHDGQNVFDEASSAFGEWGVDEALDSNLTVRRQMIVVAVDNGGEKRINEYSPYDMDRYGKGEGDQYVDFLVKTLKPYIDRQYRTRKGEKNTFIAGSSMGGLISFYAILKYPRVFGGAGVFSPAFWITPQLKNIDPEKARKVRGRIYLYAGQSESESMVPDMLFVAEQMKKYSKANMRTVIRAEGKHNETTWRKEFPLFYEWILK